MPPWQPDSSEGEFEGERRLDPDARSRRSAAGSRTALLEGDPAERPASPVFPTGWQLGTPDLVVAMPEPFAVPADGPDVFRNFVLPIPLTERRYVRALEFRPGNPRVLHHARILLDDTGDIRRLDARDAEPGFGGMDVPGARFPDGHFLGWAPGKTRGHGSVSVAARTGHRLRDPDAPEAERPRGGCAGVHRRLPHRRAAGEDADHAAARLEDDRHPGRRSRPTK